MPLAQVNGSSGRKNSEGITQAGVTCKVTAAGLKQIQGSDVYVERSPTMTTEDASFT